MILIFLLDNFVGTILKNRGSCLNRIMGLGPLSHSLFRILFFFSIETWSIFLPESRFYLASGVWASLPSISRWLLTICWKCSSHPQCRNCQEFPEDKVPDPQVSNNIVLPLFSLLSSIQRICWNLRSQKWWQSRGRSTETFFGKYHCKA